MTMSLMNKKDECYYHACAIARRSGFESTWSGEVPTGKISCWTRHTITLLIQQLGEDVEIYTNQETPDSFAGISEWLSPC